MIPYYFIHRIPMLKYLSLFSVCILPIYSDILRSQSILLFSKIVIEYGGVTEDESEVVAVVSYLMTMIYERFSMRDPAQSL